MPYTVISYLKRNVLINEIVYHYVSLFRLNSLELLEIYFLLFNRCNLVN